MISLSRILQKIHRKYEGNVTYPAEGTDDYALREGFVIDAIEQWAYTENMSWKELYTTLEAEATGTKTTTANTATYACPTNLYDLAGNLTVDGKRYVKVKPENFVDKSSSGENIYMLTRSSEVFYITLAPTPTSTGLAINYSYYKKPNIAPTSSTILEMSMPDFAVFSALAALYELDTNTAMQSFYEQKSKAVLDQMMILNDKSYANQPGQMEDFMTNKIGFIFGE